MFDEAEEEVVFLLIQHAGINDDTAAIRIRRDIGVFLKRVEGEHMDFHGAKMSEHKWGVACTYCIVLKESSQRYEPCRAASSIIFTGPQPA
jgi:hypothetical protein